MQFQHLFVDGPTFFKEQIAHLEIAIIEAKKPVATARTGRFSDGTLALLDCIQSADKPLTPAEVAEITGFKMEYCRGQLSWFVQRPEVYGLKLVTIGKKRAYAVL